MENTPFQIRPSHGGNIRWAAQVAGCSPFALLDFSASINPLGPPASAIAAIQAAIPQLVHYPDPSYTSLLRVIAQHHHLPMDWILPGNGAAELLTWIARDLAALSACYLITPAFGDYRRSLKAFGGEVRACPLSLAAVATDEVDWLATLLTNLQHDPSQCGLLLNSPHNPTGLTIPRQVIQKLLTCFGLVVVDEAFMDFLPPAEQDRHSLLNQVTDWENLVVLRSLTKFYSLPGLRLGYAIAPPHQLQRWQQWRDPWPVNSLAAVAAEAALVDTEFQQQTWEWLAETRPNLLTQLSAITGIQPVWGTANYLLLRCDRPGTELQRELLQHHHILIRDCLSFSELGDHYVRIAIRTEVENQQLVAALRSQLDMG